MEGYYLFDSNPGSRSSHCVELMRGFDSMGRLMIEHDGREWWVYGLYTKPEYRGRGVASRLIDYVEREYGPFYIESENDPFWQKRGYRRCPDGRWRKLA